MDIIKIESQTELDVLLNLLQEYEQEFSAITKKKPNDDGIYSLDVDLDKTDNFLLRENEMTIGFCVKGESDNRHDIYEFYIIPSKRGSKLGREFAKEIFKRYGGDWQVRQIEGADKAIGFWRKAISEFTNNNFEEIETNDDYWGKITKQIFKS